MSFAENLHYLRKRDKITQEELADSLGVSRQSVSKWETGEAYPETDKLIALSELFKVSLDDILKSALSATAEAEKTEENASKEEDANKIGYAPHMNKFSRMIALGVFLILLGVSVCVALSGFSNVLNDPYADLTAVMGGATVVLFVAAAVFLFIFSGIGHERFMKEHPAVCGGFQEEEKRAFDKRFRIAMAGLVSAVLLDVIVLILFTSLIDAEVISVRNKDEATCYVTAAFLFALSFLVGGLVYYGIQHTKYDLSKYNKECDDKQKPSPRAKLTDAVCGAIMMTATALFLVLGFVCNLWHPAWVVFPVGGIVCGIVSSIMNAKSGK